MKKIISAIIIFTFFVYAIPIVTVGMSAENETFPGKSDENSDNPESSLSDTPTQARFDERTVVSVSVEGQIQTMSVHDYLTGVVAAEMPASFPIEALKAQAVAARSYMLYSIENGDKEKDHAGAQLCTDHNHCTAFFNIAKDGKELWEDNCDYYRERIEAAVESTNGVVATSNGKVIAAVFHSASGKMTESAKNVWGVDYPYLVSVANVGGNDSPDYYGTFEISGDEFKAKIHALYPNASFSKDPYEWFKDSNRSQSGGVIDVLVGGVRMKGTEIREILGLNSTNFKVEVMGNKLIFTTVGTGHGVGMSQYGAKEMALEGKYFDEIICHYYNGVHLMVKN